ncbi:MAG TPA: hypothetical protein VFO35_12840 [Steroidobacteraceae bacterium]|nr:hypothetical protein [Steroidobacteraceae bacterium]
MRAADYARFWRQAERRLRYDFSELLERGLAAVIERSSGAALNTIVRNKYSEVCHGGRKFMDAIGGVILQTEDWIS